MEEGRDHVGFFSGEEVLVVQDGLQRPEAQLLDMSQFACAIDREDGELWVGAVARRDGE